MSNDLRRYGDFSHLTKTRSSSVFSSSVQYPAMGVALYRFMQPDIIEIQVPQTMTTHKYRFIKVQIGLR